MALVAMEGLGRLREAGDEFFPNFDPYDAYNSGTRDYSAPYEPIDWGATQQSFADSQRIEDGLGHWWDSAIQDWRNMDGTRYNPAQSAVSYPQEPIDWGGVQQDFHDAQQPPWFIDPWAEDSLGGLMARQTDPVGNDVIDMRGVTGLDEPSWPGYFRPGDQANVNTTEGQIDWGLVQDSFANPVDPTARARFVDMDLGVSNAPFQDPGYESPWNPPWMQEEESPFSSWSARQTDPMEPGYVEDSRFPVTDRMLGSPLDFINDKFFDPFAETAAQLNPAFQADNPWEVAQAISPVARLAGEVGSRFGIGSSLTEDQFEGLGELGAAARDSGGNPLEFARIQDENFNERPWWQQMGASAAYDPTNLIGVGTLTKLGLVDDAAQWAGKVAPDVAGAVGRYGDDVLRNSMLDTAEITGLGPARALQPEDAGMVFRTGQKAGAPERMVVPDSKLPDDLFGVREQIAAKEKALEAMHARGVTFQDPQAVALRQEISDLLERTTGIHWQEPRPLANERLWFHSTRDLNYALPDPDMAVGTQTGITQGPGIYMAADPAKSAGNYGPRTFVTEFDGKTLDLTARADPAQWSVIRQTVADRLSAAGYTGDYSDARVFDPRRLAAKGRSELKTADNGYAYRDALVEDVYDTIYHDWNDIPWEEQNLLLGRFKAAAELENPRVAAQSIVQDAIAANGVDALFHHSPRADGDVLIVLNGDAARVVADVKNAPDAVKSGATLKDIKRGAIGNIVESVKARRSAAPLQYQNLPDGGVRISRQMPDGTQFVARALPDNGAWVTDLGRSFDSKDEAIAFIQQYMERTATGGKPPTAIRSFGESGNAGVDFAARLGGQTALGAGIGAAYGEASGGDWKTGAMVGAGIGAGTAVGFKTADTVASKGVTTRLGKNPAPPAATKLVDLLKAAKPIRETQEDLYSAERARRAAIGMSALKSGSPQQGFANARASLGGALPTTPDFAAVQHQLTSQDMTDLLEHIRSTPLRGAQNDLYTKINAEAALVKALTGNLPTRGEIQLLGKVFGDDLAKALLDKRTFGAKAWETTVDALNIPRSLMTAWDASAPLRQGAVVSAGHPIAALKSTGAMIKAMASPKFAQAVTEGIENSPNASIYEKMGLYFADTNVAAELTQREEAIMSRLIAKIPGVGGSQRGYATFLNKLRQDVADSFIARNPQLSAQEYKQFGHFINIATGRGDLPKVLRENSALLNAAFAPRYAMSRLQLPGEIVKTIADPRIGRHARGEMARDLLAFTATGMSIMALGQLSGLWRVELDPRSTDFGKGRIGPQRFDFWAGEQQIARYSAQLITGQRKTSTGEIKDRGRPDVIKSWLNTKLSPPVGFARDVLAGEDFVGNKVDLRTKEGIGKQLWERLTPLFIQDMAEAAKVTGSQWRALSAAPSGVGASVMTYEDSDWKKRDDFTAENYGGRRYSELRPTEKQAVDQTFGKLAATSPEGQRAAEVLAEKTAEQEASDARFWDTNKEQWRKDYSERKKELAITNEEIYHELREKGKLETKDPILKGYYDAIDAAEGPDGRVDWDKVDDYRASLDQTVNDYITAETGLVKISTDKTQAFQKDYIQVRDSGFFDRQDEAWDATQGSVPGLDGYRDYYDWRDTLKREIVAEWTQQGLIPEYAAKEADKFLDKQTPAKAMEHYGKMWRNEWMSNNPEAALLAWRYGYWEPTADQAKWLNQVFAGQSR